jgi:hypothetical protein
MRVHTTEVHHRVPQCLLRLHDQARAPGDLTAEALAAWFEWEMEAMRYGVDPDIDRDELAGMIDASTVEIARDEHRCGHEGDFVRWGRRGGCRTRQRHGRVWFALISRQRWGRIDGDDLALLRASRRPIGACS